MNETITKNSTSGQVDLSLASLVEGSRKNHIKGIAARYDVKVSDKMTKQQMTEALLPAMEISAGLKLRQYSPEELELLLSAVRTGAADEEAALRIIESAPFADGMIFLSAKKEKISVIVPRELVGKVMAHCAGHCFVSEGDELARTARVCALIYGAFTPAMLANAVNAAYKTDVTAQQAEEYLAGAQSDTFTYADGQAVFSLAPAAAPRPNAESLDYALPTRREIEAYAAYGLDSTGYYYRQAISFVYGNQVGSYEKANELMRYISLWCVCDGDWKPLLDAILETGMPLAPEQIEFLLGEIAEIASKTRMQTLKGHIYSEVEGNEPIAAPRIVTDRDMTPAPKPAPVRVGQKIGRNDPCPCGSGKKYKKCHGRNAQ